jgi:hypothetical protein
MEKRAIIDPQITPDFDRPEKAAQVVQPADVKLKIRQLDSGDFCKKLSDTVADNLKDS